MALSHDPLWPRAGSWPAPTGDGADAEILGVPTHLTSLSPTNAHSTPAAIRQALRRFSPALVGAGARDLDDALRIVDAGDVDDPDGQAGRARARAAVERAHARSRLVIALGGDNALTVPVAQGVAARGLITLDAHHDLREGSSNGSPVRELVDAGMDPHRIVQIGIADFANSAPYVRRARDWGITVITADEVRHRGLSEVVATALEVAAAGSGGVHLDVDVDVCDRAVAPGCPASVPGGLDAWQLRALVRESVASPAVVSMDIAEVDAQADAEDGRTVRLAALCVLEGLAALSERGSA